MRTGSSCAPSRSGIRPLPRSSSSRASARSMLWWEERFCRKLADAGRFVVRYDHRDTGRSITYEPGRPQYTGADLVADAVGVLDGYGIAAAHVVGVSAGGAFAQLIGLDHPDRVLSLVVISSSPATPTDRELPPPTEEFGRFVSKRGRRLVRCRLGGRLPGRLFARAGGRRAPVRRGDDSRPRAPGHRPRPQLLGGPEPRRAASGRALDEAPALDRRAHPRRARHRRIPCSRSSTAKPSPRTSRGARCSG